MMFFAIFGLGPFGRAVLEYLRYFDQVQTVVVDRDEAALAEVRELAAETVISDLRLRLNIIRHIPDQTDVFIIDLGDDTHATLNLLNTLSGAYPRSKILVSTADADLVDVYKKIGATDVIVPSREAAIRIVPTLISGLLYSYIPVGKNFLMAEIKPAEEFVHKTLRELNLRQNFGLNVVAIRSAGGDYELFDIGHRILPDENLLVVGSIEDINRFLLAKKVVPRQGFFEFLKRFFGQTH